MQFPLLPRRRWALAAVAAVALVVLAFGGGYLVGHAKTKPTTFATKRVVPMHGGNALALLRIAPKDSAGNWPMQLEVNNLPRQHDGHAYYELWLTRNGKPLAPCGTFRVNQRDDDRPAVRAVRLQGLRRLGRHEAGPGHARSRSCRAHDIGDRAPGSTAPSDTFGVA